MVFATAELGATKQWERSVMVGWQSESHTRTWSCHRLIFAPPLLSIRKFPLRIRTAESTGDVLTNMDQPQVNYTTMQGAQTYPLQSLKAIRIPPESLDYDSYEII